MGIPASMFAGAMKLLLQPLSLLELTITNLIALLFSPILIFSYPLAALLILMVPHYKDAAGADIMPELPFANVINALHHIAYLATLILEGFSVEDAA